MHNVFCCGLVALLYTHILHGHVNGIGAIIWLPHCQWSDPYSSRSLHWQWGNRMIEVKWPWRIWVNALLKPIINCLYNPNTTDHNEAVSTFVGIYCRKWFFRQLICPTIASNGWTKENQWFLIGFGDNTDLLWWNNVNNQFCQLTTRVS